MGRPTQLVPHHRPDTRCKAGPGGRRRAGTWPPTGTCTRTHTPSDMSDMTSSMTHKGATCSSIRTCSQKGSPALGEGYDWRGWWCSGWFLYVHEQWSPGETWVCLLHTTTTSGPMVTKQPATTLGTRQCLTCTPWMNLGLAVGGGNNQLMTHHLVDGIPPRHSLVTTSPPIDTHSKKASTPRHEDPGRSFVVTLRVVDHRAGTAKHQKVGQLARRHRPRGSSTSPPSPLVA